LACAAPVSSFRCPDARRGDADRCLLLSGCAGSSLLLLPDEEGGQGAVAILDDQTQETRAVVAEANSRSRLSRNAAATRRIAPDRVNAAERALLASLPPRPISYTLYFQEGSTRLEAASAPTLAALRAEVSRRPGVEVQVTGHTDREGSNEANDRLSQRRAEDVIALLAAEGIPADLMVAVGRGEREPLILTDDGVQEPRNRRVEVTVR
jgi:outer membrane protein OmpA-like peptidoglycan-associated protein